MARGENEPARAIAQGEDEGLVHDQVRAVALFERADGHGGQLHDFEVSP